MPTRNDQALLHGAQALDWGFGGSVSRDFCVRFLVKLKSGVDVGRANSFIGS